MAILAAMATIFITKNAAIRKRRWSLEPNNESSNDWFLAVIATEMSASAPQANAMKSEIV